MILGHERQIKYLEKVLKNGRFAHAYLFSGPEGVGKFTLAKAVAQFFYCEAPWANPWHPAIPLKAESKRDAAESAKASSFALQVSEGHRSRIYPPLNQRLSAAAGQNYRGLEETDECPQCKLIEENLHPQVVILDPEQTLVSKKEKRKEIPIEDIRELKRKLAFSPAGGQWRVVIINQADKMSPEAEAAFLKLLEEPGSGVLFILVSASKDSLSETIVSRTQVINFSLVPEKALVSFLNSESVDGRLRSEILGLARGRAGKMFEFLADKDELKKERELLKEIKALFEKTDLAGALHLSEKAALQDELRQKIPAYLILVLRERLSGGMATPSQKMDLIRSIKKTQRIWQIMETTNVNARLALDAMFLEALKSPLS